MLTRRQALLGSGALAIDATCFGVSACAQTLPFATPLPVPPLIDAYTQGNTIAIVAQSGQHAFVTGQPVPTYGYSGALLGPTLRMRRGEQVAVSVRNELDATTTVHWHGLLIPSDRDGGPHDPIAPGASWRPTLPIDQGETTAWYHPHPHRDTARQVYAGLGGLLLIEDGTGARLGLPRAYGVNDFPIILQDRLFDRSGALIYPQGPMTLMQGARGNTILVNGAIAPLARVPAGIVRLRLLNASNARNLDLSFEDGRMFHVIGSDGGYLASPVAVTHLIIGPAERFEVLVDFSDRREILLGTGPDPFPPMMMGMMGQGQSSGGAIMRFVPDRRMEAVTTVMPQTLVDMPSLPSTEQLRRRRFVLNDMGGMMGGMMGMRSGAATLGINGQAFDMERIDAELTRGAQEIWEIQTGMMAHPFHVHGAHFRILSLDGASPPPHLQGWKDTVLVRQFAEILLHFTQPASRAHPYMFHCHILEHEDAGMMGQYVCT
jgi:FtsP/CotA-like multicopper oxidase with cupredoxin domain